MRAVLERDDLIGQLAEIFRRYGYAGTSIGVICQETGAGRSSLYHFFPGGKEEMAEAVLNHVSGWFADNIFAPLDCAAPQEALPRMAEALRVCFRSGQRICLVGAFALDEGCNRFSDRIRGYFTAWRDALEGCLRRGGLSADQARAEAVAPLAAVQGGIVLARATGDADDFQTALECAITRALHLMR